MAAQAERIDTEKDSRSRLDSDSSGQVSLEKDTAISISSDEALGHLRPDERDVITRQIEVVPSAVNYFTLFRFATREDFFIIAGSLLAAIGGGVPVPLMSVLLGNLASSFSDASFGTYAGDGVWDEVGTLARYMVYIGIAEFVCIYICMLGFIYTGQRITQRTREEYLRAILRQNIGFFDSVGAGEITKRITTDTNLVQEGISEKVALAATALSIFVTAFVTGFIKNWQLTLILISGVIAMALFMGTGTFFAARYSTKSAHESSKSSTVAQEVISSIRNITAFGIQEKLAVQYRSHLEKAQKWEKKKKVAIALMIACIEWTASANDGLAYWQGARFIVGGTADVSAVITIATNILLGAFALASVVPHIETFEAAITAAKRIYSTIDRKSPLDSSSNEGHRLSRVTGAIELQNIRHIYPSRPDVVALEDVSLSIAPGKTTALVGASGSGKSSIVGLLERFYDPVGGAVYLDGINIRDLNLRFLRQQIALVSQEPTLFNASIEKNIRYGLLGSSLEDADPQRSKELVVKAAKMANAHNFISKLPAGYKTNVGEYGSLLSGGQKQRIAIARAIIGNPKILILDEATSALDTTSESIVQAALDRASRGRTTIVIAHRLSTIKNADNIVVMSRGNIVEQGTHNELVERKGDYHALVMAQQVTAQYDRIDEEADADEINEKNNYQFGRIDQIVRRVSVMCAAGPNPNLQVRSQISTALKRRSIASATGYDMEDHASAQRVAQSMHERKAIEVQPTYTTWQSIKFILSFNRQEKRLLYVGLFGSIIAGCCYPTSVVFLAKCMTTILLPASQYATLTANIDFWCSLFFMLAFVNLASYICQGLAFAHCSERLTFRAQDQAFRAILRQDISFFDKDDNTTGALTSFLFTQTTHLAGLSGATLGAILTFFSTLIPSMILGVAVGWELGLICMSCVPVLLAAGFYRLSILTEFENRSKKANDESASRACEATAAIRTVASLTLENEVYAVYHQHLTAQRKADLVAIAKSSTLYAFSQSAVLWCLALGFWYGGHLVVKGQYYAIQFFICVSAIIIGAQSAGVIFSFAPDMGKAKHAAQSLQTLFDRKPKIDVWSNQGDQVDQINGAINLRNVAFHYPTRPDQPILRGLSLSVKPGEFVALVGESGSGKSTIIQLLERFYDPLSGNVFVDGKDISRLNINQYRSYLSLVSQEPALYNGTIKENILLGAAGDASQVTEEAIVEACKAANIYDFILSLPDGMNTLVGAQGSLLSGGQKQRIAIARALVRNPKILLLDEATSALDSESEKVVQAALDAAAKGRTTVAVAHRLSTIQNADVIYVIDHGVVVERGTHQELLQQHGKYRELFDLQNLEQGS